MSWFKRTNPLEAVVAAQRDTIEMLIKEVDYHRERADQVTNALLSYQQKPVVSKPPDHAAQAALMDKALSFFKDEDGMEEVA